MKKILTIIAAIVGVQLLEWPGLIVGAVIGWLLGAQLETRAVLSELRETIDDLQRNRVRRSEPSLTPVEKPTSTPSMERAASTSMPTSAVAAPVADTRGPPLADNAARSSSREYESAWQPASPATDTVVDVALRWIKDYFTNGNTLVRVGAIILFFGVAFLLKYAAEQTTVPIELRLMATALGAIVLLVVGWRLRRKREGYALALQGTAVGILYLVVFAAFRLYAALPSGLAFVLLTAIGVFAAALAVLQNSMGFALLGITGGFLAPLLIATDQGNHVALFSYYLLLNLGIVGIAWFKAWRPLNVLGFLFTFVIGTAWGVLKYRPDQFISSEGFLIAFFLLYVAVGVLYALRQTPQLRGYVDSTIIFGTPIVGFGLQAGMLRHDRYALALSAVAVSALYLGLATAIFRSRRDGLRILVEAFWALGVVFATLAVPLALNGHWTAATWALEGAAVLWLGCRQHRPLARAFGVFLQLAAGISLLRLLGITYLGSIAHLSIWLDALLLGASALMCAILLHRYPQRKGYEAALVPLLFLWALTWWLAAWLSEVPRHVPIGFVAHSNLFVVAATAALCSLIAGRFELRIARPCALLALPLLATFALFDALELQQPFARVGYAVWPSCLAMWYWLLARDEASCSPQTQSVLHSTSLWLMLAVTSWQVAWWIEQGVRGAESWSAIAWALVPALSLFALPRLARRGHWPFSLHRETYMVIAGGGIAGFLLVWSLLTNIAMDGDPKPLPFVPLLNPLDLAQAAVLLAVVRWWWAGEQDELVAMQDHRLLALRVLGVVVFVWLNAVLLRTLHHWAAIPYKADVLLQSTLVQAALSIFWTLLALTTMFVATRFSRRALWIVGAALMTVVVAKLFLVDLSRIGTVERIVSFIVVGILMLVIGYFAPVPPAQTTQAAV